VSDGGTDWEDEEESPERPFGTKPFGTKPFGTKPFGTKPFGTKPFGTKPFGTKPFGTKPFGTKPFGTKPFGTKPFGTKGGDGDSLDPEEWSADIAQLVCERSVLIRLGATLIAAEQSLLAPVLEVATEFGAGDPEPQLADPEPPVVINPRKSRLSAGLAVSARVLQAAISPELAYTMKAHLADALAAHADRVFLAKVAGEIDLLEPGDDPLQTARKLVKEVRDNADGFRNPGWIFGPNTLDELTTLLTADGLSKGSGSEARTLDSYDLLQLDGVDGGVFLGFPFLVSAGAGENIYFAADWEELWIGLDEQVVSMSAEPASADKIAFRASMPLDFALRTTKGFAVAGRAGPDEIQSSP
jgi:hypothetical protein